MERQRKISNKEFITILRENAGLYARTARAISRQLGIEYSRQSVLQRAKNFPEIMADIQEENIDVAEEGLHSLMRSKSENIKLRSIELFLKTKGKSRGYIERSEIEHSGDAITSMHITVEPVMPGKELPSDESQVDISR